MPSIAGIRETVLGLKSDTTADVPTPQKRRLRSNALAAREAAPETPIATPESMRKSPRQCLNSSPTSPANGIGENSSGGRGRICNPAVKNLTNEFTPRPNWNPEDMAQMAAVKEALHLSTAPSMVVCREAEQKRIVDFCKGCIERAKAGSLYVCGCPGTGKTLAMEKVRQHLVDWAKEAGFQPPDVLAVNCTSLTNTSEIFSKMIGQNQAKKRTNGATSPLQHLQSLYSQQQAPSGSKMMLIIADELDYLITRDRAVLHDLFMLTTFPSSRCILIGIANAIDLADRFLPRLQSLNCKPVVITFKAYSKDQILRILQERLTALPVTVFHPQALELCARKVAAASGDMRKALCVCRNAIETLEAEIRESANNMDLLSEENGLECQQTTACESRRREEDNVVRIDHMATALSKAYRSRVVDTIQSLPQHQQIILCSAVKSFRGGKKDTTVGELNKSYVDICKFTMIPPVGIMEFSSMCTVLNDQGLIKVGQSRDDKSRRVSLKVDGADIIFALQVPVFFGVIRSAYALRGDLFLKREHLWWHTGAPGLQQRLVSAYTAKKREVNMEVLAANFSARSSSVRSSMYELVLHTSSDASSISPIGLYQLTG